MKCPKCGAYNADNAEFCNLCQHPFQKEVSASAKVSPTVKVDKASSEDTSSNEQGQDKEQEEYIASQLHKSPGFKFKLKKKSGSKDIEEVEEEAETPQKEQKKGLRIGMWLLAAILSAAIGVLAVIIAPKDQINANLSLLKMLFVVFTVGLMAGSDGILKAERRSLLIGCSLGLSAGCLAFISIFLSLFLIRISPGFYTLYAMGSEVLALCVFLAVAVGLYWSLEKLGPGKIAGLVFAMAVIFLALSVLVLRWTNPLPVAAFLAWPVGYYIAEWLQSR